MKAVFRLALVIAAALCVSANVNAQRYPDKPVRVVVPFPSGGALDVLCRTATIKLSEMMGQQFVVENRPGATGHLGSEAVAKSKPDGYTLLCGASSTYVVSPHVMKINYDPLKDLTSIGMLAQAYNVLVVNPTVPARDLGEFIAYAKANPGKLSYGSYGIGSNIHLATELFKLMAGLDMVHVPYASPQVVPDLVTGRIQVMIANLPQVVEYVRGGKLRLLAIASPDRVPELPGVPNMQDTLPGFSVIAWGALFLPAGAPREIADTLSAELRKLLESPDVKATFAKSGFVPYSWSAEETNAFIRAEFARWGKVVKDANIKVE